MRRVLLASLLLHAPLHGADYERDIKPLLHERCYACHGALKQKAGLRLDTVGLMRQGGDEGDILAGAAPLIVQRVTATDKHDLMPPEGEGARLSEEQVALLQEWIAAGAPGPDNEQPEPDPHSHWAYQPPEDHGQSVDALIDKKLAAGGLKAQASAGPETWLRRVYLDLIGLPPTPEEIREFLAASNKSDQARPRVVDRLLGSPHYGERWGRHFMDIWRYADWYGLGTQLRHSQKHLWHWRDWIVESLNADKGYDKMIVQMLAADELAPQDRDNLRATGFLARGYYLFNRTTWLDDTIEHTCRAFLGLTMQCVKCHDHKYDPVEQSEYYQMRAIFEPLHVRLDPVAGVTDFEKDGLPRVFDLHLDRPTWRHVRGDEKNEDKSKPHPPAVPAALKGPAYAARPVELPAVSARPVLLPFVLEDHLRAAKAEVEEARNKLATLEAAATLNERLEPETQLEPFSDDFKTARPDVYEILSGDWRWTDGLLRQHDTGMTRRMIQVREPPPRDFTATASLTIVDGEKWKSVGISFDSVEGDEVLVYISAVAGGSKAQVSLTRGGQTSYPSGAAKAMPVPTGQPHTLELRTRGDLLNVLVNGDLVIVHRLDRRAAGGRLRLTAFDAVAEFHSLTIAELAPDIVMQSPGQGAAADPETELKLARLTLALAEAKPDWLRAVHAAESRPGDKKLAAKAAAADARRLFAQAELDVVKAEQSPELKDSDTKKKSAAEKKLADSRSALADAKKKLAAPGEAYTLVRASLKAQEGPDDPGNAGVQRYPETSTGRRLGLARWIADERNPLTARVLVNHVWLRHFGEPLVADVSDFGRRSPEPLHQDVLDTLAARFMANGWSLKWLHRELVLSRAYGRLSSLAGADAATLAVDPDNLHYWRMNPRRMESQAVRDSLLHLSGRLDPALGGPTIDPVRMDTSQRRSLYFNQTAHEQNALLGVFDNASVLECYRREESVAPQQALALVNSRASHDSARALAGRLSALDEETFIRESFLAILGRAATAEELQASRESLAILARPLFLQALFNHNDFVTLR
jgi:hypothetical protein